MRWCAREYYSELESEDFATATEEEGIQAATLKTVMGKECRQILSRLDLSDADKKKPGTFLEKLEESFAPTRNVLYERYSCPTASERDYRPVHYPFKTPG